MSSLPAKIKKIRSKLKALECSQHYTSFFFRRSRADNSGVGGGIWPKFEHIQAFMHVLVTCKNEDDAIKMKALECSQDFSHYKSMGLFPDAQGQLTLQSIVGSSRISNSSETLIMVVFVTCKNEDDPIKNEGAGVFTTLYIIFSDMQGQISLGLVLVSG